jgi:putative transcriptional regulator
MSRFTVTLPTWLERDHLVGRLKLLLPGIRARRRLSQRQPALLAGVRPDTVSALERGESTGIRFDTLVRLCEALDCSPGDLLEVEADSHSVPVLGGPDEDEILRERLAEPGRSVDGPTFIAELLEEASHRRRVS